VELKSVTDFELGVISRLSYDNNRQIIDIDLGQENVQVWKVITDGELIDNINGLHGYVLEKDGQMIVSFEGTNPKSAEAFWIDLQEDINGIVLGKPGYTDKESRSSPYIDTPSQDAAIAGGSGKLTNSGEIQYHNNNQFVSAKKELDRVAEANGYDNMNHMVKEVGKDNVTMTGHSLGGGLAEYFAIEYDVQGVTFAAAGIYNLLSPEKKKAVDEGDYRNQIISYTYASDVIGTDVGGERENPTGSVFYMKDDSNFSLDPFKNHGMENYLSDEQFGDDGYYRGELLIGKGIRTALMHSPLYLKNSGDGNFPITIKTESMKLLVNDMQHVMSELEVVLRVLTQFSEMHDQTILATVSSFMGKVGSGAYSELNASDVTKIVNDYAKNHGTPALFYDDHNHKKALEDAKFALEDTEELISRMHLMVDDMNKADQVVANWIR